jgi:ribonuclease P protein component
VSVTFVPDEGGRPRFAYGVGRAVGPAVVRNRVRRRLRSAAREIALARGLPSGAYLVTVRPGAAELDYASLRRSLDEACLSVAGPGPVPAPGRPA